MQSGTLKPLYDKDGNPIFPRTAAKVVSFEDRQTLQQKQAGWDAKETPDGAQGKVDAHADKRGNPHGVTAEQVGAAETSHKHAAGDIASGVFPVARGGMGLGTVPVGSYLAGNGAAALQTKTPSEVATDIGASDIRTATVRAGETINALDVVNVEGGEAVGGYVGVYPAVHYAPNVIATDSMTACRLTDTTIAAVFGATPNAMSAFRVRIGTLHDGGKVTYGPEYTCPYSSTQGITVLSCVTVDSTRFTVEYGVAHNSGTSYIILCRVTPSGGVEFIGSPELLGSYLSGYAQVLLAPLVVFTAIDSPGGSVRTYQVTEIGLTLKKTFQSSSLRGVAMKLSGSAAIISQNGVYYIAEVTDSDITTGTPMQPDFFPKSVCPTEYYNVENNKNVFAIVSGESVWLYVATLNGSALAFGALAEIAGASGVKLGGIGSDLFVAYSKADGQRYCARIAISGTTVSIGQGYCQGAVGIDKLIAMTGTTIGFLSGLGVGRLIETEHGIAGSFATSCRDAIALTSGTGGDAIQVAYSGTVAADGVTEGQRIDGPGVSAYAPRDGWLKVLPDAEKSYVTGSFVAFDAGLEIIVGFAPALVGVCLHSAGNSDAEKCEKWSFALSGGTGVMFKTTSSGFVFNPGILGWSSTTGNKFSFIAFK